MSRHLATLGPKSTWAMTKFENLVAKSGILIIKIRDQFRVLSIENEVLITRFGERGMMGTAIVAVFAKTFLELQATLLCMQ